MWSVLTRIFTKNSNNDGGGDLAVADGGTPQPPDMDDTKQAKQRASVKWLLSKAFNNKVPENLREPFYRDHENQERLKPQIVRILANAEIYCMALGNIYSDPNYHNLNHSAILQTLAKKGVYVSEPSDAQMTETTLIQTNPLRMSAHMAVIESIMVLYAREVITSDRVFAAVQRFNDGRQLQVPENHEQAVFVWMSHACDALRKRIEQETESGMTNGGGSGDRMKPPDLPAVHDLKDLTDGVALAALISYYCPDELPWTDLKISYVRNVQDSLYNISLVQDFCNRCLPVSIFHIQPEDFTYMRDSMRYNLIVFLADLFNVIEIHPAKCVRYPGMDKFNEGFPPRNEHGVAHKRNLLQTVMTPIPDLRSGLDDPAASAAFQVTRSTPTHVPLRKTNSLQQSVSEMSEDSLRRGSEESFVVHRGKNIPTLRSVVQDEPLIPGRLKVNKEKQNNDSKADERGEVAAGKPSNWEENRKSSFAGRRSRRNSTSDDSQLTIENFGGSQDNLNFIGRNPDKEVGVHVGRKISAPSFPIPTENPAVRSSLQDARGSIQLGYDNGCEKRDDETEKFKLKRQLSSDDISLRNKENFIKDVVDAADLTNRLSFAELNKQRAMGGAIQLVYMQHDKEDFSPKKPSTNGNPEKKTSFAALPNTTTWQQQSSNNQQLGESNGASELGHGTVNAAQLNDVRLKLEEKRRLIETEKRRVELAMSKQRQKVGKAAFLQAVAREIQDDATAVERKWLDETQPFIETRRTPDLENMDLEQYQQSIAQMNSSLGDIQSDIQRLTSQQNQIQAAQQQSLIVQQQKQIQQLQQQQYQSMQQQMYSPQIYQQQAPPIYAPPLQSSASAPHIPQSLYQQSRIPEQPQFFLHDQTPPPVPQRRTWAQQPTPPPQEFHQPELRTWNKMGGGFVLHDKYQSDYRYIDSPKYQNGSDDHSNSFTLSQQHHQQAYGTSHSTPSASPQHRNIHRQISQLMDESKRSPVSLQQMDRKSSGVTHAPIPAPSADDMEPQNISFIGNSDDQLSEGLSRLNITSGSRTYRIPSPTRPLITRNSFQPSPPPEVEPPLAAEISSLDKDPTSQKGFYIQFDNDQPKRPKPPLRTKRSSPKKERSYVETLEENEQEERSKQEEEDKRRQMLIEQEREKLRARREASQESKKVAAASAIIIENDKGNPDPDAAERMKQRIMQASMQRKLELDEARARKEAEAQARREREKAKEEERARKKEEQAQRRAAILEQYKLKKAMEEAEREGKVFDKSELMGSLKPTPKMRPKAASRPRPKTIHIDSGSVEMAEGMMQPSRGKKGSTSNLTGSSTDQDSLAYRYGDTDSGLGRATPPRRAPSPGMGGSMRHLTSPSGPGSLPGLMSKGRRIFDDGASDISSTPSSMMDYTGPRLYKQPATKSNRGIMLNAVEYCVFPGVVNREAKKRVLEEINRSESKHFLILFRDAGCQFRALYSYCPDREEVFKLYGTGPKQVNDRMFDKFFKYNSGGKCFSQVHTKHLTVTIDAFTIHNSLWQGKKVNLPNKKDMPLVI
nr:PREDICTED: patronin isoform X11 [Tribolium castaneum]|eukprot:XP_008193061.1 PREDICTED: patronin isoform X11 [Tribolium castaneum]